VTPGQDRRIVRRILEEGDSYGTLFVAILVTYALSAIIPGSSWERLILTVSMGCVLLLAMQTSHVRGRPLWAAAIGLVVATFASGLHAALGTVELRLASYAFLLLIFTAPVVVLNRVLRHPVINFETIMGAVDAYLLIGIAFASLFGAINALGTQYFFEQKAAPTAIDFLYFSFVVLTTVGFGDLTPRPDIGKVAVTLEALLGQIFLVTIVAALVSNLGRERHRPGGRATSAARPEPSVGGSSQEGDVGD
jgi:hypothetical protein